MGSPFGDTGASEPQGAPEFSFNLEGEGQDGQNPAWNEFLSVVPQELHEKVTPVLQKWDQGVQNMVQKVHSEYEPFKQFKEAGVDPQSMEFAVRLLQGLQDDPKMIYETIGQHYGFMEQPGSTGSNSGQGQGEPPTGSEEPSPYEAQIQELQRQQQIIAQTLLNERKAKEEQEADLALNRELDELREKYKQFGDFDEEFVLAKLMQNDNMTTEQAVQAYYQKAEQIRKSAAPRPLIMGSGGGLPNQNVDVTKLDSKARKNLVSEMLRAAAEQDRQ